jgi:leucyl aminopeptidase
MDIAGPAFVNDSPWAYNAKGATGYGVRTLVSVAERLAAQRD